MSEHIIETEISNGALFIPYQSKLSEAVREEIVRCRDCRAMRVKYGNTGIECWMNGEPFTVEPDGFCAWAVKRKEGE